MTGKIKLFTDSAADLPKFYREKYDVSVVPLSVIFAGEEFKDQVNLTTEEFWERLLKSDTLPSTNQVNPHEFVEAFEPHLKAGATILYIGLSSKLSGTLQSAHIAKELLDTDRIHIFDTKSASMGISLHVIKACEMLGKGHSLEEVLKTLTNERDSALAYFVLDSLTNLVKGGRLTKTQGLLGTMLNIKPILMITPEGTIEPAEKARSTKKALQTIVAKAQEQNIDFSQRRVAVVHTHGADPSELVTLVEETLNPLDIVQGLIGSTIGTHAGPGGLGLLF